MGGFINLGKRSESIAISSPSKSEKSEVYYPSLYLNDKDLGLTDDDLNQELEATIKVKVTRHVKTIENGKTRESVDLDVLAIKLKDKD